MQQLNIKDAYQYYFKHINRIERFELLEAHQLPVAGSVPSIDWELFGSILRSRLKKGRTLSHTPKTEQKGRMCDRCNRFGSNRCCPRRAGGQAVRVGRRYRQRPFVFMPSCFGPWKTVYDYFRRWSKYQGAYPLPSISTVLSGLSITIEAKRSKAHHVDDYLLDGVAPVAMGVKIDLEVVAKPSGGFTIY